MSPYLPDLNPQIRAEMARRNETQTSLAPKLGLTQSGLSRRLTGESEWTVSDIYRLAEVFSLPLSVFLPEMRATA